MACLKVLKEEIKTLEATFPRTHLRLQIISASVDELTCRFIDPSGRKHTIHANITVRNSTLKILKHFWPWFFVSFLTDLGLLLMLFQGVFYTKDFFLGHHDLVVAKETFNRDLDILKRPESWFVTSLAWFSGFRLFGANTCFWLGDANKMISVFFSNIRSLFCPFNSILAPFSNLWISLVTAKQLIEKTFKNCSSSTLAWSVLCIAKRPLMKNWKP